MSLGNRNEIRTVFVLGGMSHYDHFSERLCIKSESTQFN